MSEGKYGSYRVNRNAAREAQRLRDGQAAAAKSRARLDKALAQRPPLAPGEAPPHYAPGADLVDLDAYVAAANSLSAKLERRVATRAAVADLLTVTGGHAGAWTGPGEAEPGEKVAPSAPAEPAERSDRYALVERLLGRLREATDAETAAIRSLADALVAARDGAAAEQLERQLRLALQQASAAAAARHADAERVEQLLARLRGLDGDEIEDLRARLELSARTGKALPAGLEAETMNAEARARERSDREYVAQMFRQELRRRRYEISDEDLETAFVTGGRIVTDDPDNPGYALEIIADPARRGFGMQVVRREDVPWSTMRERLDAEREEEFCDWQERLRERLREAGIESWLTHREKAGTKPVPVVAPQTTKVKRKKIGERYLKAPRS